MKGQFEVYAELSEARDLVTGLLTKEPTKRLGCQAVGVDEIFEHKWFQLASDFNW